MLINLTPSKKNQLFDSSVIISSAIILLWAAINNRFPLVYPDTGGYVASSFTLQAPLNDRPLGYGLFLISGRLFNSLWVPLFLQSLITVFLLYKIALLILNDVKQKRLIAVSILMVTILITDISKFVSWLMPDIFTSWLFLGGLLFFLSNRKIDKIFSVVIIIISVIVHNSHISLAYFSLILLLFFSWKSRLKNSLVWVNSKKLLFVVLIATFSLCTINLFTNNGFTPTINSSLYFINKFAYTGILTRTLDKYCSEKNWKLCNYKENIRANKNISNWYFWGDDSPLQKLGGWEKNKENRDEYQDIVFHSVISFFPEILTNSLKETTKQLINFRSSYGLGRFDESYAVYRVIQNRYPEEFNNYLDAKQFADHGVRVRLLPINENIVQALFSAAAVISLFIFYYQKNYFLSGIILALIAFVLLNALIIGFTVTNEGRYHGKLLWMVPYFFFLTLTFLYSKNYNLNHLKLQPGHS
ncbi:MAG TPA: hypothetical protein VLN45_07290 [Ignavibacteriaceae bacterium]|nr:hypothetical protein [Ignavibacteriaceae bacterium]